jgi:hypothetical protein
VLDKEKDQMQKRTKRPPQETDTIKPAAGVQELFERGRRIIAGLPPQPNTEPEPAPELSQAHPNPDLLRAQLHDLPDHQAENARAMLLAMILKSISEKDAPRLQTVARFVEIAENDCGTVTPAENFIVDLVDRHFYDGLTPEDALAEIEGSSGFRINFNEAVELAKRFNTQYPQLTKAEAR